MMEYTTTSISRKSVIDSSSVSSINTKPGKRKRSTDTVTTNNSTNKVSVAGIAIHWHYSPKHTLSSSSPYDDVELIVGARGIRQGKKPKCDADVQQLQSILCRTALWKLHEQLTLLLRKDDSGNDPKNNETAPIIANDSTLAPTCSFAQPSDLNDKDWYQHKFKWKYCSPMYRMIRTRIFATGSPLAGWLVGDNIVPTTLLLLTDASTHPVTTTHTNDCESIKEFQIRPSVP
jgi:hypothetical protein